MATGAERAAQNAEAERQAPGPGSARITAPLERQRYEGVDQRIADHLVDGELCLGDFVLAGGEVAALAVVEEVCRLVPNAAVPSAGSKRCPDAFSA